MQRLLITVTLASAYAVNLRQPSFLQRPKDQCQCGNSPSFLSEGSYPNVYGKSDHCPCAAREHCMPLCKYSCTDPSCEQECTPNCLAPECQTRCPDMDASSMKRAGCKLTCTRPNCEVVCPSKHCGASDCVDSCKTVCHRPSCKVQCPDADCIDVCKPPKCTFDCKEPTACPKPECKMVCEAPNGCMKVEDGMPPLVKGMAIVKDFESPTQAPPLSARGYPPGLLKLSTHIQKAEDTVEVINADGEVVNVTLPIA